MDLRFEPISVPTDFEVASVLMKAAPNITAFNIDLNSIIVDGTGMFSERKSYFEIC